MAARRLAAAAAGVLLACGYLTIASAATTTVTDVTDGLTDSVTDSRTVTGRAVTTAATTTDDRGQSTHHADHSTHPQQHGTAHDVTDPAQHDTGDPHNGGGGGGHAGNDTNGHGGHKMCPPEGEEGLRYVVAKFDFEHVKFPFIVGIWVLFVTYAKIAFHSCEVLEKHIPESCLLIVIGVILGIITFFASDSHEIIEFDTQLFFTVILPPIIMEAGYFMPTRAFFDQLGTILLHAVVATLANTLLIGLTLWGLAEAGVFGDSVCLPLLHALVFASLLAAVDPVAVLAVFESIHVNQLLYIIVFGESLLNDGVAVVLYHVFSELSVIGGENVIAVDIVLGIVSFFVVVVGSLGIGTLMGLAGAFSTRFTRHMRVMEPMIVVVIPYLAFIIAEMFHLSGILSCTACGIAMRKYVEANIAPNSKTTIRYVMKMLASVAEAVIFMFLGISAVSRSHEWNTEFVILTLIFCLIYRAVVVVVLNSVANLIRSAKLDGISQFVMAYGGLRGAIAFSLAVVLEEHVFLERKMFITTTIVVVYFTNIVLGTTMQPLVKILKVKTQHKIELTMSHTIGERVLDHVMVGVEAISQEKGHHHMRERFLAVDYYLRPIITGKERPDKNYRAGAAILKVYKLLAEEDAMALTKMPDSRDALMRWNASLRNIAAMVRNHTTSDLQGYANAGGPVMRETAIDGKTNENANNEPDVAEPTSPFYNLTLSPLSPEVLENTSGGLTGNQLPLNPPGVTPSRSFTNLSQAPDQGSRLRRSASNRSTNRPVSPRTPEDQTALGRHLKADRDKEGGGSMRDKGSVDDRRRFRPGWMPSDADGGVDNPAMTLEPVVSASFSVGDPDEVDPSVAITVTDSDQQDSSAV